MAIYQDFKRLLALFNSNKVEYLVVGSHALAFYGALPRRAELDLYVRPTKANAARLMAALDAFGFGDIGLRQSDFEEAGQIIRLGDPRERVALVTSIHGVSWEQAVAGQCPGECEGEPVPFIGRTELIANKKAAGRPQDLADAERLEGPPSRKPSP
jgi:hypothetical protein